MLHFLTGDELGNIKSVECAQDPQSSNDWKLNERIIYASARMNAGEVDVEKAKAGAVQRLSISELSGKTVVSKLGAARSNGSLSAFSVDAEDEKIDLLNEWQESRFMVGQTYVGLNVDPKGLFWCTSNGALGFAPHDETKSIPAFSSSYQKCSLPTRLCAWHLSADATSFAYGGDEVDLSVWDTERALQAGNGSTIEKSATEAKSTESKKRKREAELFPGEVWRAKNLPNDSLSLRQPIHISSLSYLPSSGSVVSTVHLATGTLTGDVRRYDTRAARRPVASWTGIGKNGGVSVVQAGLSEYELFVADNGTNLSALDLRNGRTIYSYKKLQGTITSISPSAGRFLGSASRDRFVRLHSTFPPPEKAGSQQEEKGDVLGSVYMKTVPTAIVFDISGAGSTNRGINNSEKHAAEMGEDDDVWVGMEDVEESEHEAEKSFKSKRRS
ncbi:hypothetical protein EW145_g3382 [Phellinidium pouzarii]|uniref:Ribosome biogenesis protein NSA1 n=1 Tax=Phellinidium pouzarii TaxID=167371 RepID=A0A4S4L7J5_9AGAM|nr:hypothetical protein EW145_g3382 [Phellinidium pouzarii]